MVSELEIEVRSTELDSLGHVNNAKYLEYLEWGRFEWLRESRVTLDFFGRSGLGTVIANININYRREAKLGDRLRIRSWLAGIGRSSFQGAQAVYNQAGELVCDATTTSVMFDTAARRSVPIPDELRAQFEAIVHREGE